MASIVTRGKYIVVLLLLIFLDILPIPILGMMALFVLLFRPRWFKELVDDLYSNTHFE